MDTLWNRVEPGAVTAIVGVTLPAAPAGWRTVRVSCQGEVPHAAALAAREALLRAAPPRNPGEAAIRRLRAGLRRRLLGDTSAEEHADALVGPMFRLAHRHPGPTALVFEHTDRADPESLLLLLDVVAWSGRLGSALVLCFDEAPAGAAQELLDSVRLVEGPKHVIERAPTAAPDAADDDLEAMRRELVVLRFEVAALRTRVEELSHRTDEAPPPPEPTEEEPGLADDLLVRAENCLARALMHWHAAGAGPAFTLQSAHAEALRAHELLAGADALSRAEAARVLAGVLYDIGDPDSLEDALEVLTDAMQSLMEDDEPTEAARLLNDQAAVWVRIGDPLRAWGLLERSREIFEAADPDDPAARIELAETNHLVARLPLHVGARPGLEGEALAMARDSADRALGTYDALRMPLEVARVLETRGRLGVRSQDLEASERDLRAAFAAQEDLGDVVGMARTTGAMAELGLARGNYDGALTLLAESVRLNGAKGSPRGLAENRRALLAFSEALPPPVRAELSGALDTLLGECGDA